MNPEIMTILLSRTLLKIEPIFEQIILEGIANGDIRVSVPNTHLLSQFILFGISAIIHDNEVQSMEEKVLNIKILLSKLLDSPIDE